MFAIFKYFQYFADARGGVVLLPLTISELIREFHFALARANKTVNGRPGFRE